MRYREREREKKREEEPHRTEARVWYYIIINNTYTHTAHGTRHRAEITQRAHTYASATYVIGDAFAPFLLLSFVLEGLSLCSFCNCVLDGVLFRMAEVEEKLVAADPVAKDGDVLASPPLS